MISGSIWKLALAALWWEHGVPDTDMTCQSQIQVTPRAVIRNSEGFSIPRVNVPTEMLVYSCNTTAVAMSLELRERLGEAAFQEAFRRFGVLPYAQGEAPSGFQRDFWRTGSDEWRRRMSPPPARIRLSPQTSRQEWAQLAIGQGPIDVTPIHISRFLQAIGNGGVVLRPPRAPYDVEWREAAMADPVGDIIGDYRAFAARQRDRLGARGIDIHPYRLSHLAVRVPEWDQYVHVRSRLERHAVPLRRFTRFETEVRSRSLPSTPSPAPTLSVTSPNAASLSTASNGIRP